MRSERAAKRLSAGLLAGILLVVLGVAGAAVSYSLTQTFPSATAPSSSGVTATCSTLTYDSADSAASGTPAGSAMVFNCPTAPAFTVATAGTLTPTFSLPSGATALYLLPSASTGAPSADPTTGNCSTPANSISLKTTTGASLTATSYDYCLQATAGAAILGFPITWA